MPILEAGAVKTAKASMTNPTLGSFSYTGELYLGAAKVSSSGKVSFSLAAGETKQVSFPVTMPSVEGTYPVFLDVFVGTELVGAYQANEDVTTVITPGIVIGPVTWG